MLFAHHSGVYAVLGASVEKISEEMGLIFDQAFFSPIAPQAVVFDLNNRHVYGLLISYSDPFTSVVRSLILIYQRKVWYVLNQGSSLQALTFFALGDATVQVWGSSGSDVTPLIQGAPGTPIAILLQTALTEHDKPNVGKKLLRCATGNLLSVGSPLTLTMTVDTENGADSQNYTVPAFGSPSPRLVTRDFAFVRKPANGTGIYCGLTISGNVPADQYAFHSAMIEYQDTTALASQVSQ